MKSQPETEITISKALFTTGSGKEYRADLAIIERLDRIIELLTK